MAMVVHQIEKGVGELERAVARDIEPARVRELSKHLSELIEGLAYLTRRSGRSEELASALVRYAVFNTEFRLQHHGIDLTNRFPEGARDFKVEVHRRLAIAAIMNLIDNSIWWTRSLHETGGRIYIGSSDELGHPAILVADNGPGFIDAPEALVEPFMSRRRDGMGLGLHLADQVMKNDAGRLAFPRQGDVTLPEGFDGAVVALVFSEAEWMD